MFQKSPRRALCAFISSVREKTSLATFFEQLMTGLNCRYLRRILGLDHGVGHFMYMMAQDMDNSGF